MTTQFRNFKVSKTQAALKRRDLQLVDHQAYRDRCTLELSRHRQIRTYADVVALNETVMNGLLASQFPEKGKTIKDSAPVIDNKAAALMGYLLSIQLQAIRAQIGTGSPEQQVSEKLKAEEIKLGMSDEELVNLCGQTNLNVVINILNKAVERPRQLISELNESDLQGVAPPPLLTAARNAIKLASGDIDKEEVTEAEILQPRENECDSFDTQESD